MWRRRYWKVCFLVLLIILFSSYSIVRSTMVQAVIEQGLNKKKVTLAVGTTATLQVRGLHGKITWSSDHPQIANINQKGKITAMKKGSAIITANVNDKASSKDTTDKVKKFKCKVTVVNPSNVEGSSSPDTNSQHVNQHTKVTLTVGDTVLSIAMENNQVAKDFIAQMPLEMTLKDLAGEEKYGFAPKRLDTTGVKGGYNPVPGDVCCYVPWGNVCIYYGEHGYENIVKIGTIEDNGVSVLQEYSSDFKVTFAVAE